MRDKKRTVKAQDQPTPVARLRELFGLSGRPLTYQQLAACLGPDYTMDQVRKWDQRVVPDETLPVLIRVFGGSAEWYRAEEGGTPPDESRRASLWAQDGPILGLQRASSARSQRKGYGGEQGAEVREGVPAYNQRTAGPDGAAGFAAWVALGAEMQHNLAVKIFKEALEAQDFAGSPVLRALYGIAEKMQEMGYSQMSRHIWAEMGKYFGQQLPPEEKP